MDNIVSMPQSNIKKQRRDCRVMRSLECPDISVNYHFRVYRYKKSRIHKY